MHSYYYVCAVIPESNPCHSLILKVRIGSFEKKTASLTVPFLKGPGYNGPRNEVLSFLNNSFTTNQVARDPARAAFIVALTS